MAYVNLAHLDMESHESDSAVEWAQRGINLAQAWGRGGRYDSRADRGWHRATHQGRGSGWDDLERSLQLALAHGSQEEIGRSYASLAAMAISRRQYTAAWRYQEEGLAYCEKRDLDSWWLYIMAGRARLRFEQGDWQGACDDVEAVLRHPRATPITRIPVLETLSHVRIRRGDPIRRRRSRKRGRWPGLSRTCSASAGSQPYSRKLPGGRVIPKQSFEQFSRRICSPNSTPDPRMRGELAAWLFRVDALQDPPTDVADAYALEISGDWRGAAKIWQELGCLYERACLLAWNGAEAEHREALSIFTALGANPAAQVLRKQLQR